MLRRMLRPLCLAVFTLAGLATLCGCRSEAEIRIQNRSSLDFTEVRVAGQSYGSIPAGATSAYKTAGLRFRYAALRLKADGREVTAQTLNMGAKRFTYQIDVADLAAGHLAIAVVAE